MHGTFSSSAWAAPSSFTSVQQLVQRIDHLVAAYNASCKPFKWTTAPLAAGRWPHSIRLLRRLRQTPVSSMPGLSRLRDWQRHATDPGSDVLIQSKSWIAMMKAQRPQHAAHHGEDFMAREHSNVAAGAAVSAVRCPPKRLEAPSALVAAVSVCAVLCMCSVVWAIYATFTQQSFNVQETVLRPLAAWVASVTGGSESPRPQPDHLTAARKPDATRVMR